MYRSVFAAFVVAVIAFAVPATTVGAVATCFGKPVTHVMQPGVPYTGTTGDDVVIGTAGPDSINLWEPNPGGIDFVCGGGGNDEIHVVGVGSKVDGGNGNDQAVAFLGGLARGGSGDDIAVASGETGRAEGGSGSDTVTATGGATGDGGSGNDTVMGLGAGALFGGSGRDIVNNIDPLPNTKIDCGAAFDTLAGTPTGDVQRCEQHTK